MFVAGTRQAELANNSSSARITDIGRLVFPGVSFPFVFAGKESFGLKTHGSQQPIAISKRPYQEPR